MFEKSPGKGDRNGTLRYLRPRLIVSDLWPGVWLYVTARDHTPPSSISNYLRAELRSPQARPNELRVGRGLLSTPHRRSPTRLTLRGSCLSLSCYISYNLYRVCFPAVHSQLSTAFVWDGMQGHQGRGLSERSNVGPGISSTCTCLLCGLALVTASPKDIYHAKKENK